MFSPRIEALLDGLDAADQVRLLAGTDFWHTAAIEHAGVEAVRVTDGPAGARGTRFEGGPASINTPCGTALAATWDPALIRQVGALLGREVRAKGAAVHLAPTVNLHRTPVGGRNFECFSEDPLLTAEAAVAYVDGVQSEGAVSCIKHFVGNDTEFERHTIDSQIDERALRELYLAPFEAAVKRAGVGAVMTSYNRINGSFAADSDLIADVLRGEWGFDGVVMSDWFGLKSTEAGVRAGTDLEMPGPSLHRGAKLLEALRAGAVDPQDVRTAAGRVLALAERVGALDGQGPGEERATDDPDDRSLVRRAAAAAMVLLRNEPAPDGGAAVLPLDPASLRRVAVIGPNADRMTREGGGSAHVDVVHVGQPLDALTRHLAPLGVDVVHHHGCAIHKRLPPLERSGCGPITVEYFRDPASVDLDAGRSTTPEQSAPSETARLTWFEDPLDAPGEASFGAVLRTSLVADRSGDWQVGLAAVGDAVLAIDGRIVLDNRSQPIGGGFFGFGKGELVTEVALEAGRTYAFEARLQRTIIHNAVAGLQIGAYGPEPSDPVADAVDLAVSSDIAIVVVGTNDDWESEGWDRDSLALPGRQDELVARVAEACPRTVVVINAGSPVAMPWLAAVPAVVVAWFPGQAGGDALADVLLGTVDASGRLPVTFPRAFEDTPAFEHHPGRNGVAAYIERRLVGYRWYDTVGREPLFPFGFGLSYAAPSITAATAAEPFRVRATVSNPAERPGTEVVQVYVHALERGGLAADHPEQALAGFARVQVPAGGTATVDVDLDQRCYLTWDPDAHSWVPAGARFELRVGRSSRNPDHVLTVTAP